MQATEPFSVSQFQQQFRVCWPPMAGPVKLTITRTTPNAPILLQTTFNGHKGEACVDLTESLLSQLYFHLETPDGKRHLITGRAIPSEKIHNFRDFGGYRTLDGRQIRWRTLFRSGHLGLLTDQDRATLQELNIAAILDFRTQLEVDYYPSRLADEHTPQILPLAINAGSVKDILEAAVDPTDIEAAKAAVHKKMLQINETLVMERHDTYRQMFEALLNHPGGYLLHCSAGKDRTGLGVALILSALGADRDTILSDYLLTNRFLDPEKSAAWFSKFLKPEINLKAASPMFSVHQDFLQQAFQMIDTEFGGSDQYLKTAMALSESDLNHLRNGLLYPAP